MKGFKLLAIRPLSGISEGNLKNLKVGEIYKFHSNYSFYTIESTGQKGERIDVKNSKAILYEDRVIILESVLQVLDNLYSREDGPKINITAVVGKNGSGKSTLIELLLKAINNIIVSTKKSISIPSIKSIKGIHVELYYKINDDFYQIIVKDSDVLVYVNKENEDTWKLDLSPQFFFTHLINYSLYSFIDEEDLERYFHRNDGYWEPIFISPKRENNMIDVKHEIGQSENNLLFHLSHSDFQNINNIAFSIKEIQHFTYSNVNFNKGSSSVHFIREEITEEHFPTEEFIDSNLELFKFIYLINFKDHYFDIDENLKEYVRVYVDYINNDVKQLTEEIIKGYLIVYVNQKITKIVKKKEQNLHDDLAIIYIPSIDDPSHESFKFYQSIFLLNHIDDISFDIKDDKFYFTLDSFRKLVKKEFKNFNIFQKLPLSGFKIHLYEDDIDVLKRSSGQLQQINVVSNILTTLVNLNSRTFEYFEENQQLENAIDNYENVCVILDEIELNLHPELQRDLVALIVKSINNLNLSSLSIHLIFLTHSPFILSDIPAQNILRLEHNALIGKSIPMETERQTFGANIHDLLSNSFFLSGSFKGAYAQAYVFKLIDDVNAIEKKASLNQDEYAIWKEKINLVAEPFIKSKLFEKLDSKFENLISPIDEKIKRMHEEIDRLENLKTKKNSRKDDTDKG